MWDVACGAWREGVCAPSVMPAACVHLDGNRIGDAGMEHIARALESNSTLTEIDFARACSWCRTWRLGVSLVVNGVGDGCAEHVARALERNTSITKINLERGLFTADGVRLALFFSAGKQLQ